MKTESNLSKSDRRKGMIYHIANGIDDSVLVVVISAVAVAATAVAAVAATAVAATAGAVTGAVAAVTGAAVAGIIAATARAAVANRMDSTFPYKDSIPDALVKKCRNFGRVLGASVPLACGLAAGVLAYNDQTEKQAALLPVPVTEMAPADLLVCPKGMMVQAFNTPVSQDAPVATSVKVCVPKAS